MEGEDLAAVGTEGDEHGADASDRGAAPVSAAPRNVWVGARYTTLRLEPIFWEGLADIAASRRQTVNDVITEVEKRRRRGTLTSAVRVRVLRFYRDVVEAREAAGAAADGDSGRRG
jgi:predicted DNA-binding ribbon-helix-helix protein